MSVRKEMSTAESSDHLSVKTKIEEWLDAEGISFEQVKDLNSFFHIKANLKNVGIHISESKVRMGVLAVQGILDLNEDQTLQSFKDYSRRQRALISILVFSTG